MMARPKSASPGTRFEVTLSEQSVALLKKLAVRGIYGRTPSEVGGRFIEQALQNFVDPPRLALGKSSSSSESGIKPQGLK
jgi:hypothetical protein